LDTRRRQMDRVQRHRILDVAERNLKMRSERGS
jgi:hypothetical protein